MKELNQSDINIISAGRFTVHTEVANPFEVAGLFTATIVLAGIAFGAIILAFLLEDA